MPSSRPAGECLPCAARLQMLPEQQDSRQTEKGDEVRGMRRRAQHTRTGREDRVCHGRHAGRKWIEKFANQAVQYRDRAQVRRQKSDVYAGRRLSKEAHHGRIGDIGPGQFHAVGELVGRHSLKDQLTGVGEFTLVALQGKVAEPNPHVDGEEQGNGQQGSAQVFDVRHEVLMVGREEPVVIVPATYRGGCHHPPRTCNDWSVMKFE